MNEEIADFKGRLRWLMNKSEPKMSIRYVAGKIGVVPQTVKNWLDGTRNISPKHLIKLANFFDTEGSWLIYGKGKEPKIVREQSAVEYVVPHYLPERMSILEQRVNSIGKQLEQISNKINSLSY
jgi:transcriptional regulator with XRE-family HTH domain